MTLAIEIPEALERHLRNVLTDLNADAKEAMLVELYRGEKISRRQLSDALGLGRLETDSLLHRHKVVEDLPTNQELEEDLREAMKLVRT
jgi:hypothetical protein